MQVGAQWKRRQPDRTDEQEVVLWKDTGRCCAMTIPVLMSH
jgi:hypothetical protein